MAREVRRRHLRLHVVHYLGRRVVAFLVRVEAADQPFEGLARLGLQADLLGELGQVQAVVQVGRSRHQGRIGVEEGQLAVGLAAPRHTAIALNAEGAKKYTGLVVDARGLGVKPVLAPRLLDGSGKALYGAAALSDESRATSGVAAWFDSLEAAKKATLVGEKPLVVKATGLKGSDLVLASDDAKALGEVNTRFLAEGRVVIVTQ